MGASNSHWGVRAKIYGVFCRKAVYSANCHVLHHQLSLDDLVTKKSQIRELERGFKLVSMFCLSSAVLGLGV